ncbi:MAG: hypothetical protein CTY12_00140 [Methylotenera sp.]|nr:MAG: hypothetical protein CTY12_00140 [Methylotenera sp.]
MVTKFNLIKSAQVLAHNNTTQAEMIKENISYFASQENVDVVKLSESITHVLAGLSQTAANMNPKSVAFFLAGVEKLASGLASAPDNEQKQNSLRVLANAAVKHDELTQQSLPNHSVVVIAQYGAKFPDIANKYMQLTQDPQQIEQVANKLKQDIDQAMRSSGKSQTTNNGQVQQTKSASFSTEPNAGITG